MRAHCTRLYTDDAGASRFEDVAIPLSEAYANPPASPLPFAAFVPTAGSFFVGVPASWDGDMAHPCPRRQILVTVRGEYRVTVTDGTERRFPPGSVLLAEDTTGLGHMTSTVSADDVIIFAVALPAADDR